MGACCCKVVRFVLIRVFRGATVGTTAVATAATGSVIRVACLTADFVLLGDEV